jgi:hypothetical protein
MRVSGLTNAYRNPGKNSGGLSQNHGKKYPNLKFFGFLTELVAFPP